MRGRCRAWERVRWGHRLKYAGPSGQLYQGRSEPHGLVKLLLGILGPAPSASRGQLPRERPDSPGEAQAPPAGPGLGQGWAGCLAPDNNASWRPHRHTSFAGVLGSGVIARNTKGHIICIKRPFAGKSSRRPFTLPRASSASGASPGGFAPVGLCCLLLSSPGLSFFACKMGHCR